MALVLDKADLKTRIDALRTLRGLTQVDLAELFAAKGHGTQELGRLERGALPLTEIRKRSLAEILDVPERFFEEEHLDLNEAAGAHQGTQLDRLEQAIADIARREDTAAADRRGIQQLLAKQSDILDQIADLLADQDRVLKEIQRVVDGMPNDANLRMFNEAAQQLVELAEGGAASPDASEEDLDDTDRRAAEG